MMTLNELTTAYNELAYTHKYIFGFEYKHEIIAVFADASILNDVCVVDTEASNRGGATTLRFKPTKAQKALLLTCEHFTVCSKEALENEVANCKYNRGEIFEKRITETYGQEWTKDHVPFTEAGDIEIDGIAYQIKFNKATFCSDKFIRNHFAHMAK